MTGFEYLLLYLELSGSSKIYSSMRLNSYPRIIRSVFQTAEHCILNGKKALNRRKRSTVFPCVMPFPRRSDECERWTLNDSSRKRQIENEQTPRLTPQRADDGKVRINLMYFLEQVDAKSPPRAISRWSIARLSSGR